MLPYNDNNKANVIANIRRSERPSRPTDPSQSQWLQDRIWDTITTCWSNKPEKRCKLPAVHHLFSKPSPKDPLVEFPPTSHNLGRLVEELLYTFLILPLDPHERTTLIMVQHYISNLIREDGTSRTRSFSTEVVERFRQVKSPR